MSVRKQGRFSATFEKCVGFVCGLLTYQPANSLSRQNNRGNN